MLYTFYKDKLAKYGVSEEDSTVVEYTESVISTILYSVVNKESQHHHVFGSSMDADFIDKSVVLIRKTFPDCDVIKYSMTTCDETVIKTGFIISWADVLT